MELTRSRSLSVIIYDDHDGAECFELAQSWTESGLLGESVWVPAAQTGLVAGGAPRVTGHLVAPGAPVIEKDLFTLVGVRRLDVIRVVALQVASVGSKPAPEVMSTSKIVAEALRQVLPRDVTRGTGTKLLRVNLIVPESATTQVSRDRIHPDWEINAVASPEDRPDLDRASIFVRAGVNLHGHATAAVAAVGGLWPGMDAGAFDAHETDSTSSDSDLIVFRASSRLLLGDEPGHVLANMAMTSVRPSAPDAEGATFTWGIPAREPARTVDEIDAQLQKHGEWGRDLLHEMEPLKKPEQSFKTAFGEFFAFQGRLLLNAGRVIGNRMTRAAEDAATSALVGRHGDFVIRAAPRSPNDVVAYAELYMKKQSEHLRADFLEKEVAKASPPSPATWSDLRQLCFGLVDGGDLPAGFTVPQRATLREYLRAEDVAPDPDDKFRLPDGELISPVDVNRISELRAQLSSTAHSKPDQGATQGSADPTGEDGAEPVIASEPIKEHAPAADHPAAMTTPAPVIDDETQAESAALLGRLDDWMSARSRSLLWKTASHTSSRKAKAQKAAADSLAAATGTSVPDPKSVFSARTLLLVLWTVVAGVWLLIAGVVLAAFLIDNGPDLGAVAWGDVVRSGVPIVVVGLLVVFFGGWKYYRALSHYEWEVRMSLASRRHAADTFVVAKREADRLSMLEHGLEDWSQVIGWLVHRPWLLTETSAATLTIDPDELPASVALAAVEPASTAISTTLIEKCVHSIFSAGWTTNVFDRMCELMAQEDGGATGDRGYLDADLDGGLSSKSRPDMLARFVSSHDVRSSVAHDMREKVDELVTETLIVIPAREVSRLGRFSAPDPMEDVEFFAGALGPRTPFVEETWTDSGRLNRRHLVEKAVAWLPSVRALADDEIDVRKSLTDSGVRVDYSPDCHPDDIKLFAPSDESSSPISLGDGTTWN